MRVVINRSPELCPRSHRNLRFTSKGMPLQAIWLFSGVHVEALTKLASVANFRLSETLMPHLAVVYAEPVERVGGIPHWSSRSDAAVAPRMPSQSMDEIAEAVDSELGKRPAP